MSVLPESAELANHSDPVRGRRRGFGFGFLAMMAFAAACLIAAAIVAIVYGVFSAHGSATKPAPATSQAAAAAPAGPLFPAFTSQAAPTSAAPAPPGDQLATLEGRVGRLEAGEARSLDAAAAALAAASLSEAAGGPRPFINELAAVERLMPGSLHVQALAPLASTGAPTRAALASELADIGARVSIAARTPAKDAGFMTQLGYAVSRVVSIRRVDAIGGGPDAVLARAQKRAADGDLEGALSMLNTLPASSRTELGDWRDRAQRRVEIDDHIAALRALALADLSSVAGAPS